MNLEEIQDRYFSVGGPCDYNGSRIQTRKFGEAFIKNTQLPSVPFTLLDVGCALASALPVFKKAYPHAQLFGCDISKVAISRCNEEHGNIAHFFKAGYQDLVDQYDIIYCSNVLEHFSDYLSMAEKLLKHCKVLYVMTPYYELKKGEPLKDVGDIHHKVTFRKESFDPLFQKGSLQTEVKTKIIRAPGAWSPPLYKEPSRMVQRIVRMFVHMKYFPPKGRQIVYKIVRKEEGRISK